ncbi:MAG: T9SS C-terminal target domain-containing protein [Chitinophagaceae bacterium]|nr:MAG: T9SS C-terminal target domain-containing protein [Chitinophagaceae bacterium]
MRTYYSLIILSFLLVFSIEKTTGQVVINNANLQNFSNTKIHIHGDVYLAANSTILNENYISINGNFINNSGDSALINVPTGIIEFSGDDQFIGGTEITTFNNLHFSGTGIKTLEKDVYVRQILDINDREIATLENKLYLLNTDVNSLITNEGFVSSIGDGRFSRNMESMDSYYFPLGSSDLTERYRPLEITPSSNDFTTFEVRMVNNIPTDDGFDVNQKDNDVIDYVNEDWYHLINQTEGNQAVSLLFFYDEAVDNDFDAIVQWQGVDGWKKTTTATQLQNMPPMFSSLEIQNWADFSSEPFSLAYKIQEGEDPINSITNVLGNLIDVYPNPATEYLIIKSAENFVNSFLNIYDINGKELKSMKLNGAEKSIQLSDFSKGVYLLTITNDKGVYNNKIVIQ